MSFSIESYGDVQRIRMSSFGSRAFGLDVSAYVIRETLIDSGFPRARRSFFEAVDTIGIRGCIVTHWHEDHAGNVPELARRGVPVLTRPETEEILRRRPSIGMYRRFTWGRPPALDVPLKPFDPDGLECIHTPGHSRDHQVVWDPQTSTLFSGDLWLGVRARAVHSSEDPYAIIESLRLIADRRPVRMFDAHRGLVEPALGALERRIDWLTLTLSTIERRIAEGWDDDEILKQVLGGEPTVSVFTQGDYTTRNLVRAVRRTRVRV